LWLITSIYQQLISLSSAYNLLFLLLPTEDAFPLLVLLVPCFSEAAREQHCFGLLAELKICSASDLVFSSSPSSQHNSSLGKAQALLDR